ncbi:unnamed protein product [Auanema sp. JU1783]|nr:unnamed protein product [Auanema sp. JU1783]
MSGPNPERAKAGGIPDRWLYCPKIGQVVADIFLPFKVPLCSLYDDQIDKQYRFHPEDVFKHPSVKGKKIGLWVDLTNTDRFYFTKQVTDQGCQYRKIKMAGHKQSPTVDEVDQFIRLVRGFINSNPGQLVAVHCTHGFNRTGFVISSFMVTVMDWSIDAAIQTFAGCRPTGIYKQDYINDLFERFGDGDDEDIIEAPEKPSWEYNEDRSFHDVPSTSSEKKPGGKAKKQFMDGLVQEVCLLEDAEKRSLLQAKIKELCRYDRKGFPGLQPVSLECSNERNNLEFFSKEKFLVSWKADGMRYMVYIGGKDEVYAFDRDNEIFIINNLEFPHSSGTRHLSNTLVDAEMIIENVPGGTMPRLLIYDIIQFEEFRVAKDDFEKRRFCLYNEVIKPRTKAMESGHMAREKQSMSVRIKEFWPLETVQKILSPAFQQNLGHEVDGLIFQPVKMPYLPGRCDKVLKWKPPSHNSVDFKLQIRKTQKEGQLAEHIGYLYVQHSSEPFDQMKATRSLLPYDNKIIECTYEVKTRTWKFMRERTDKSLPNSFNTARSVFNSMLHPIEKENLIQYIMAKAYRSHKRPNDGHRPHPPPKMEKK